MIGKILKALIKDNIREIITEVYTQNTIISNQVLPAGVDSSPLADDQGVIISIDKNLGKTVHVGIYPDPIAAPGEVRLYSRDENGTQKAEIYMTNDGSIIITGETDIDINGDKININAADTVTINSSTTEINGNADNAVRYSALETAFNQLKQDYDNLVSGFNAHVHATAAVGPPVPPTPVPPFIPASSSTADITGSKIDEVKVS